MHKARQADCHLKQTEPYSPWQNAAESTIRELKKVARRNMIKSNSPKKLWDDWLELEMEIRSCTANNVVELKGEVPRTVMKGETANITYLCEFGWNDWLYFRDNLLHTLTTNGFWEDSLALALILAQHCVRRS